MNLSFIVLLIVSWISFPISGHSQENWKGTRHGMSKAEVQKLFGSKLKVESTRPDDGYDAYNAFTLPWDFCGGKFEVVFVFIVSKPADRLIGLSLSTGRNTSGGSIGNCVVREYIAAYGKPQIAESGVLFERTYMFTKAKTIVDVSTSSQTDMVFIKYSPKAAGL